MADDLGNLKGTAWGVLNAVSDMAMHRKLRTGSDENSYTNRMLNIAEFGETTLDKAYAILSK